MHDRHRTLTGGSDILHVRNLHNFIKSVAIAKYLPPRAAVLDLACGDRRAARRHALQALRAAPWHPAPWALLAATWGRARWVRACQQRWPLFTGMALPAPAP